MKYLEIFHPFRINHNLNFENFTIYFEKELICGLIILIKIKNEITLACVVLTKFESMFVRVFFVFFCNRLFELLIW